LDFKAPVDCEPAMGTAPDQPPEAAQAVALEADHCSVAVLPVVTVPGAAASATVGAGAGEDTDTVAVWLALPPAPVQVIT
jgi:hypothetical protein